MICGRLWGCYTSGALCRRGWGGGAGCRHVRNIEGMTTKIKAYGTEAWEIDLYSLFLNTDVSSVEVKGQMVEVICGYHCIVHRPVHLRNPLYRILVYMG